MNNILDKCIFIRCPLKETCLRFGKHRREGQKIVFRYNRGYINSGCKNYFNVKHFAKQKLEEDDFIKNFKKWLFNISMGWNTPIKKQVL